MITDEEREKYTAEDETYVHFKKRQKGDAVMLYTKKLCQGLKDVEKLRAIKRDIWKYEYDTEKKAEIKAGYTPDLADTIKTRKGICLDLAALMTACLRTCDIPTKLCCGYIDNTYHAWCEVYVKEAWELYDPVFRGAYKDDEYQTEKVY